MIFAYLILFSCKGQNVKNYQSNFDSKDLEDSAISFVKKIVELNKKESSKSEYESNGIDKDSVLSIQEGHFTSDSSFFRTKQWWRFNLKTKLIWSGLSTEDSAVLIYDTVKYRFDYE